MAFRHAGAGVGCGGRPPPTGRSPSPRWGAGPRAGSRAGPRIGVRAVRSHCTACLEINLSIYIYYQILRLSSNTDFYLRTLFNSLSWNQNRQNGSFRKKLAGKVFPTDEPPILAKKKTFLGKDFIPKHIVASTVQGVAAHFRARGGGREVATTL